MKKTLMATIAMLCALGAMGQNRINQNQKIKDLMEIKKEFGQMEKVFQLQIFNGKLDEAEQEMKKADLLTKLPVSIIFETPNYKVRVGKFRTRIEAEKALVRMKKNFPNTFVIAPY